MAVAAILVFSANKQTDSLFSLGERTIRATRLRDDPFVSRAKPDESCSRRYWERKLTENPVRDQAVGRPGAIQFGAYHHDIAVRSLTRQEFNYLGFRLSLLP
ncbi:hypothetical protein P5V15_005702 [Pogonomyrmex californicus]